MKKFNLKKALAGEPLLTRRGLKVNNFTHYNSLNKESLYLFKARIQGFVGEDVFTKNGEFYYGEESPFDLFMAEESTPKQPITTCGQAPWNNDRLSRDFNKANEKNKIQTNPSSRRLRSKKSEPHSKKTLQTGEKEI